MVQKLTILPTSLPAAWAACAWGHWPQIQNPQGQHRPGTDGTLVSAPRVPPRNFFFHMLLSLLAESHLKWKCMTVLVHACFLMIMG